MITFNYRSPERKYRFIIRDIAERLADDGVEHIDTHQELKNDLGAENLDSLIRTYLDALPFEDRCEYECGHLGKRDAVETIIEDINQQLPREAEDKEYWAAISARASNAGMSQHI